MYEVAQGKSFGVKFVAFSGTSFLLKMRKTAILKGMNILTVNMVKHDSRIEIMENIINEN